MIDYREARLRDPSWWLRFRILIASLERKKLTAVYDALYRNDLALLSNSGLTEDSFKKTQQASNEHYYALIGMLQPWNGKSYTERQQAQFTTNRQTYIDEFGVDPSDPKFKAYEAEQIAKLMAVTDATELDEDRVARRLAEVVTMR